MSEKHNPLEQFAIKYFTNLPNVFGVNLNFSNSSLFVVLAVALICILMLLSTRNKMLIPGRWQSFAEILYEFVEKIMHDTVGKSAKKYFPFIFSLFMFVLFCNGTL